MLLYEHRDFNRASLIAMGHLLIASVASKSIWGADEIAGPDLMTFTFYYYVLDEEFKTKFDKMKGAVGSRKRSARTEQTWGSVHDK